MDMSRRSFLKTLPRQAIGVAGVMSAAYTAHESLAVPSITSYDVFTEKLPSDFKLNIAFITDLHVGCSIVMPHHVAHIVTQVNALNADVIIMGGDYQLKKNYDPRTVKYKPADITSMLKGLEAPMGVYGVMGNHDWNTSQDDMICAFNRTSHIRVGENERITLQKNNVNFDLVLMPDYRTRGRALNPHILENPQAQPTIIVAHDPLHFRQAPDDTVLQLSGHTHGGQVTFFGIAPYLPGKGIPQKWAYGQIIEENKDLFQPQKKEMIVSSGFGTSTVPFKNTPYEMVHVQIKGTGLAPN
jgi:predicted MPP superfamily phosphohydrolase